MTVSEVGMKNVSLTYSQKNEERYQGSRRVPDAERKGTREIQVFTIDDRLGPAFGSAL